MSKNSDETKIAACLNLHKKQFVFIKNLVL